MGSFAPVLGVLAVAVGLVGAVFGLAVLLRDRRHPLPAVAFLSGTPPREHAVSRFHARWYPVTLLFLAFDVEMAFMYPWAVVVAEAGGGSVVEMFAFLGLLMAGVVYVWREGGLRWA